jgi:hypothetical protein
LHGKESYLPQGALKDSPRSGRPRTRTSRSEEIPESVQHSPEKSVRKCSAELGVPKSSFHRHLQKDLKLHPYCPKLVMNCPIKIWTGGDKLVRICFKHSAHFLLEAKCCLPTNVQFTGAAIIEMLCFGVKKILIFMKKLRTTHHMLWSGQQLAPDT